jgi:thymidylate synthase ThyX
MKVELILDSNLGGTRVTLFRVTYPRIVHSEYLRHRNYSTCSSSSRAIPLDRMIEQYCNFFPTKWRKHQSGMQPIEDYEFPKWKLFLINFIYSLARKSAIFFAKSLHSLDVSKEQVNRLIEPYSYITHLIQGTEKDFKSFFKLRCHPTAQYEIRELAIEMQKQYSASTPVRRNYHVPFMEPYIDLDKMTKEDIISALDVSSARCARTSYFNNNGKEPSRDKDIQLANQLLADQHMSPFEFCVFDWKWANKKLFSRKVKLALSYNEDLEFSGNLNNSSLVQYRKLIEF